MDMTKAELIRENVRLRREWLDAVEKFKDLEKRYKALKPRPEKKFIKLGY